MVKSTLYHVCSFKLLHYNSFILCCIGFITVALFRVNWRSLFPLGIPRAYAGSSPVGGVDC